MAQHPDEELPASFVLPPLPSALGAWFTLIADLPGDSALIFDESVLDNLRVVDAETARRALIGYRFVFENDAWVDTAERGEWHENWIVLDSMDADPLIADISMPEVPVLRDEHGRGRWEPRPASPTLAEFVAGLDRVDELPSRPAFDATEVSWSVWAIDLGPSPLKTLVSLKKWPVFPNLERDELLRLRTHLPAQLASGLTEPLAKSSVEYGRRAGAVFEARTYRRGSSGAFEGVDLDGLWATSRDHDDYVEPAASDQLIASIEAEIGFRLPDAFIELSRIRNGGRLARDAYPTTTPTGWAHDHVAVTGLYAIGRTSRYSLAGELGATFMREEWGYPDWGIGIADTPTAGHEQIMLDYRACGPDGEPRVVYVDQEDDYRVTELAPDFATFVRGLVDEEEFDTSDPEAERVAAFETVETGSLSPIVVRALAASSDLPFGEHAIRRLGRELVNEHGFFTVRGDRSSRMLLDTMLLLLSRIAAVSGVDELLDPPGETSYENPSLPLMLFFAIVDEPYTFRTGGFAPGFVHEWWGDRVSSGSIRSTSEGWRFTAEAEAQLVADLERAAAR
ncbi:SMI1/KNR4 family protein [Microbacterium sp. P06]|uniref:SMI1/KNR4 family protein n=1 Tax=Microbacterium sp. P06 TaxID=3366949 RepID=UPI00374568DC